MSHAHATSCIEKRSREWNWTNIVLEAALITWQGFSSLGCTMTPVFLCIDHFLYWFSPFYQKKPTIISLFLLICDQIFLRMRVFITYKYPSVRLIVPEGMTSVAKIYSIGLFALKSTHPSYCSVERLLRTSALRPTVYNLCLSLMKSNTETADIINSLRLSYLGLFSLAMDCFLHCVPDCSKQTQSLSTSYWTEDASHNL